MDEMTRRLAGGTLISWADYTFNPWRGCVKVSPACRFCYAERETARWGGNFWGKNAPRPVSKTTWAHPRRWNREAKQAGVMRRVFSGSLCDVFENRPDLVAARQRLFDLIEATEWLIWMLLTKRPHNIAELAARYAGGWPPNVWLGVSAENQRFANERIPHLIQHDVAVRFVSDEPSLGFVDLTRIPAGSIQQPDMVWDVLGKKYGVPGLWKAPMSRGVDWVITGGESGSKPGIRPSHPDWYRSARDQCTLAGVPYHHKQNGVWVAVDQVRGSLAVPRNRVIRMWPTGRIEREHTNDDLTPGATTMVRVLRKKDAGRELDGQVWAEFPKEVHLVPA